MNYSTPTQGSEEYRRISKFIQDANLSVSPEVAFEWIASPEKAKTREFYEKALPVLFAASMDASHEKVAFELIEVLNANAEKLIEPFSTPAGPEYQSEQLPPYTAIISYGCLELQSGGISTMVKAAWANAQYYCDFTKPNGQ